MFRKPKHVTILKHQRNSIVYVDGRYLHVDMKVSTRSKTGRQIARDTAVTILNQVGQNEAGFQLLKGTYDIPSETRVQDPPHPPDSFTREEGRAAVRAVSDRRSADAEPSGQTGLDP